jgi:hypothetical protein
MSHWFGVHAWQMTALTPWEHDALVAQHKAELRAVEEASRSRG